MSSIISVIIPTYNRERVIAKTLDSVLAQSFKEWECLVVDDFSTDSTWSVLEEYASKYPKIHIYRNEREKGACGARNTGFQKSNSSFIQYFDSDDIMYPTLLEDLYNAFTDDVDVVTCWTNVINVDTQRKIRSFEYLAEGRIHKDLLLGRTYVDTNCALIRRHVIESIGGWSEDCPSFQEWDFHLRLSNVAIYKTCKKHLIEYNVGGSDTISKSTSRWVNGKLYIFNKNKKELLQKYPILYLKDYLSVYKRILDSEQADEKKNLLSLFTKNTDCISRFIVKILYFPYNIYINGRKRLQNN